MVSVFLHSCHVWILWSRTVGGTLRSLPLATTTSYADTVDNVSLLGLVSETASLVRAGRTRCAVDDIELTELLHRSTLSKVHRVVSMGRIFYRTSQQRTRRRKRRISLCFFF